MRNIHVHLADVLMGEFLGLEVEEHKTLQHVV